MSSTPSRPTGHSSAGSRPTAQLNAPWGLAWAPADFGAFSGDLIVGNFGNGRIHAFRWDGKHWHPDGTLKGSNHKPLSIDGLWAIAFGGGVNVANDGPTNALFYTAGPDDESAERSAPSRQPIPETTSVVGSSGAGGHAGPAAMYGDRQRRGAVPAAWTTVSRWDRTAGSATAPAG